MVDVSTFRYHDVPSRFIIMKSLTRPTTVAVAVLCVVSLNAESLFRMGDTFVHFIGAASIVTEDNIYQQSSNEVSDWRTEFDAGLEFNVSPSGAGDTTLLVSNRWVMYDSEPLDDQFLKIRFHNSYDSGVILSNVYANYTEDYSGLYDLDSSTDVRGALIPWEKTLAGGNLRYDLSELTAMKVGIDYSDIDYSPINVDGQQVNEYTGHESISIPASLFYRARPHVDLTAGVRYRNTNTDANIEYTDMYYYVGAIGEVFSPVIHADLTVGWQDRDADGSSADDSSASYKFSLIYTGDPKATVYATLARDYNTSATNAYSYVLTSATLGARYGVNNNVSLNAALIYGESEYEESVRAEDIKMARLGVSYSPNDFFRLDAIYYLRDVDGNIANYTNNEFRVTASMRY